MTLFPHGGNPHAQQLQIIKFAERCGYRPNPYYLESSYATRGEAASATDWLNDYKAEGNNFYGYLNNDWGYYPIPPTP